MPESPTESAPGIWSVPECPFTIAYVPEVMDDIRLAVVDAFFSLPRGGAEIGGILLGWHNQRRLTIASYVPLDCEHATGPSFVLSARDEAQLQELLTQAKSNPSGLQPVGWYHSHTRSEIFLSDADQQIHKRYFPESWQVALVFKPHTFQPMRCGFFFREANGSIHSTATYQEFLLEAMPLRPVPTGVVPPLPANTPPMLQREPGAGKPVTEAKSFINIAPEVPAVKSEATEASAPPEPTPAEPSVAVPKFVTIDPPEDRSWLWLRGLLPLAMGLIVGAVGFQTRPIWLPLVSRIGSTSTTLPASVELTTLDTDGQLQIRWDRSSPAVRQGTSATLTITDGGLEVKAIHLDQDHLRSGTFTYGREGEQVDVALSVAQPYGQPVRGVAAYVGRLAPRPGAARTDAPPKDPAAEVQIARLKRDLAAQTDQVRKVEALLSDQSLLVSSAAKLKNDLAAEVERSKKLEKSLGDARAQAGDAAKLRRDLAAANDQIKKLTKSLADTDAELKQQQRKRMGAQDPGIGKQVR